MDTTRKLENWHDGVAFTTQSQTHLLLHELGHNLALHHGGDEATDQKPNYRSSMNARYACCVPTFGIDTDCDADRDGLIDYSNELLDPLNEEGLLETTGICVVNGACPQQGCVPVDFNNSGGDPETQAYQFDVNADGLISTIMTGHNDWESIKLLNEIFGPPPLPQVALGCSFDF